ncbi:hypothetical protein [Brevibacillus fulvus]|uniref:Uncharacterized protein n=1 Tax=Brevibacillus fulvus TaxID=1125967 RepID=A0A938XXW9_9BACL|nr:hypothetical protein [Brevibacillus fulvus]MBM7588471.1 hypothetical protein [Brevibacillus fulvus]
MVRLDKNSIHHHFTGIRGKVGEVRELVDVLDQMFDSFHRLNRISRSLVGQPKITRSKIQRLR